MLSIREGSAISQGLCVSVCVCVCLHSTKPWHSAKFLIYYALIEVADTIHPPEISPVCIAIATRVNNWALNRV